MGGPCERMRFRCFGVGCDKKQGHAGQCASTRRSAGATSRLAGGPAAIIDDRAGA